MHPKHIIHATQRGCAAATAEIYDQNLANRLKSSSALNELASSNLADIARVSHKAIAGRGCISKCTLHPDSWFVTITPVKSRNTWYAPGQDPYEIFNGRMYGDHGLFVMQDVTANTGTLVGITLDHELCINLDFKMAYKRREDDVLLITP
jgi:hypothetical protein